MATRKLPKLTLLEITDNLDDPTEVISNVGPIHIAQSVERLRVKGIVATHGYVWFDGVDGSISLEVASISSADPRDVHGVPDDSFHLGGITGHIGTLSGAGLQGDMVKVGRGTHDLLVDHSIGHAVAYEDPKPKHQDGWQIMAGHNVTVRQFEYYGGPNSNHAAWFCSPNDPGRDAAYSDPSLITDCVIESGVIVTKAAGVVLAGCTRCGARNTHIQAHFPWRLAKGLAVDPVDEGNTKLVVKPS